MSTATFGSSTTGSAETHTWWRRVLLPLGVGVAVFTPVAMWFRRKRHPATESN